MGKEKSVAPKERVNIVYKPGTDGAGEEVELPLKILMVGDYTGRASDVPVEEITTVDVNKDNFKEVMASHNLSAEITVDNKLKADDDADAPAELGLKLDFKSLKDFEPEGIAEQVPELKKLLELRSALNSLKGPMGNIPAFRKKMQGILGDESAREQLMQELGLSDAKGDN